MAKGKIARAWIVIPVLLLCGVLVLALVRLSRHSAPAEVTQPAPNAVLAAAAPAGGVVPLQLGMAVDVPDDLGPASMPGKVIAPALRAAHLTLLRFGDLAADSYSWESDCSYGNDGRFPECGVGAGNGSSFDHFLAFAGAVGARPLIVVNGEIDDPQQAARMVAYYEAHCVRSALSGSCVQPYWEIGFSPASWRHFAIPLSDRRPGDASVIQPDQYAALVISYAAAMQRAEPPGLHLQIVADEWITGATDQSWVARVSAIDTHYAPFLSVAGAQRPATDQIVQSLSTGFAGRPGIDIWLQDLRSSLAQFTNSDSVAIIVGQWSIDGNNSLSEPQIYSGYVQALFTAALFAHLWQDAASGGANPLLAAIQYPIIGSSQEPFDATSGQPRSAVALYQLVDRSFTGTPLATTTGSAAQTAGLLAAASLDQDGTRHYLLVNTNHHQAITVQLAGATAGHCGVDSLTPDPAQSDGARAARQTSVDAAHLQVPAWGVTVASCRAH